MPITQDLRGKRTAVAWSWNPWQHALERMKQFPSRTNKPIHAPQTSLAPSKTLASYQIHSPVLGYSSKGEQLLSQLLVLQSPPALQRCRHKEKKRQKGRVTEIDRKGEEMIESFSYKPGKCVPWAVLNMQTFSSMHSSSLAHIAHSSPWHPSLSSLAVIIVAYSFWKYISVIGVRWWWYSAWAGTGFRIVIFDAWLTLWAKSVNFSSIAGLL